MKTQKRGNIMAELDFKNKFYVFLIGALVVALLLLVFYISAAGNRTMTVVTPVGLTVPVTVGQSEASTEYLLAMGSYTAFLFLNFNDMTVVQQYETLSELSSNVVRAEAMQEAESYRKAGVSSRCIVNKVEATDQVITVVGNRTKYILDKPIDDKTFTLNIKYEIQYGTFRILELELI